MRLKFHDFREVLQGLGGQLEDVAAAAGAARLLDLLEGAAKLGQLAEVVVGLELEGHKAVVGGVSGELHGPGVAVQVLALLETPSSKKPRRKQMKQRKTEWLDQCACPKIAVADTSGIARVQSLSRTPIAPINGEGGGEAENRTRMGASKANIRKGERATSSHVHTAKPPNKTLRKKMTGSRIDEKRSKATRRSRKTHNPAKMHFSCSSPPPPLRPGSSHLSSILT